MSKPSDLWVRDSLVEDAVNSVQGEASARAAEDFIVSTLERMDRKQSDAKPTRGTKKPGAVEKEFERRAGRKMPEMAVDRAPASRAPIVPASAYETQARRLINRRLRQINACPDLRERMKGLAVGLNSSKHEYREKAALAVEKLFEETDRLFGDWRKTPDKKLHFG